jgi:hypothetical protein
VTNTLQRTDTTLSNGGTLAGRFVKGIAHPTHFFHGAALPHFYGDDFATAPNINAALTYAMTKNNPEFPPWPDTKGHLPFKVIVQGIRRGHQNWDNNTLHPILGKTLRYRIRNHSLVIKARTKINERKLEVKFPAEGVLIGKPEGFIERADSHSSELAGCLLARALLVSDARAAAQLSEFVEYFSPTFDFAKEFSKFSPKRAAALAFGFAEAIPSIADDVLSARDNSTYTLRFSDKSISEWRDEFQYAFQALRTAPKNGLYPERRHRFVLEPVGIDPIQR